MALLGTLVDSFRGAALDLTRWNVTLSAGVNAFQVDGQYISLIERSTIGESLLISDVTYSLVGSHIHVELRDAGIQQVGLEVYPLALRTSAGDLNNALLIIVSNGQVNLQEIVGGIINPLASFPYDASSMRWWRIREILGIVYYDSAASVRGPWTVRASVSPSIPITALFASIITRTTASLGTAKQTSLSNINYVPAPDLAFPLGGLDVSFEMAFGADIHGDQSEWEWTNLTEQSNAELLTQGISIARGRQNESEDVSPTASDFQLDNPDGDLTPDNPISIYWPNIKVGTPGRYAVDIDTARLALTNDTESRAQVDNVAAFAVTSDLDVRVDMQLGPVVSSSPDMIIASVYDTITDQRGWRFSIRPGGFPSLEWSEDGTFATYHQALSVVAGVPLSARTVMRATLDVDNGAGGWTVVFYCGSSVDGPWEQVGPTITDTPTTSLHASTAPLVVGNEPGQPENRAPTANIHTFQLRNGINGTIVADASFRDQAPGAPAFVDSTGLTWSFQGTAILSKRWYRIVGTADSWKPRWPWGDMSSQQDGGLGDGQARVDIQLAGLLRRLGQGQSPLESPLRRAHQSNPLIRAHWPMEDGDGSTNFASSLPGQPPMSIVGEVDFQSLDTLPGSRSLPRFTPTTSVFGLVSGTFTGQFQIDWYAFFEEGTAGPTTIMEVIGTGTVYRWVISLNGTVSTVTGYDFIGNVLTTASGGSFFTGVWTHLRLFVFQNGASIDWQFVYFPVVFPVESGFFYTGSTGGSVGGVASVSIPPSVNLDGVGIGHIAVYNTTQAQQDQAAIGWIGDTAVSRMQRLCTEQRIPFQVIGNPATTALMGPQQSATLLGLLRDGQDADGGILYEGSPIVGLVYRTRESLYNQPPNMVLDGLPKQVTNPLEPVLDDFILRNKIIATRVKGSSYVAEDQASIDEHGLYDTSVTWNLFQDADLVEAAGWMLRLTVSDALRFAQASTNLSVSPEMIEAWLTVDSGARIHLVNLPPQLPMDSIRLMTQGYREGMSPHSWNPTANTTPADPWDVFLINDSSDPWLPEGLEWRLDPDSAIVTVALDTDDTTMFIVADPPAVDDDTETPFDLRVNGERMRTTDIKPVFGFAEFTGAGNASVVASTSHVAPSVVAPSTGNLLICVWLSYAQTGTYTLPGGMTALTDTDGGFTTFQDARQTLVGSGATGTRTATFSVSDPWSALSMAVNGVFGTPTIQESLSGVTTGGPAADITLTMAITPQPGDWILALQGWDWDPGATMRQPTGGPEGEWNVVADSMIASISTSRVRAWSKRILDTTKYSVTFHSGMGLSDNHARLYVLRGVTGTGQEVTVIRSLNNVIRSHPIGTPVELWHRPGLSR